MLIFDPVHRGQSTGRRLRDGRPAPERATKQPITSNAVTTDHERHSNAVVLQNGPRLTRAPAKMQANTADNTWGSS
jgi:hypothetical protein